MFTLEIEPDLQLALVEPSFAKKYFSIVSQQYAYLSQWLPWVHLAEDEAAFDVFIKSSLHDYADGKSLVCGIIYKDELVGNISFNKIDHATKKVEIGYWLSCDFQGKGIVSKSVSKLIKFAFSELDMSKVQISAAEDNLPSRRVCERLGFSLEGIITQAENLNGQLVSHAIYGLQRADWVENTI